METPEHIQQIEELQGKIYDNRDNPEWLSKAALMLSQLMYNFSESLAQAELEEHQAALELLADTTREKRATVAEADRYAVVATANKYGRMKLQWESVKELINGIKARLRILGWEVANESTNRPF